MKQKNNLGKRKATRQAKKLAEHTATNLVNKTELEAMRQWFETNLFNPIPR